MRVTRAEFAQKQSLSRQKRRPVPFLKLLLKKISQMEFREVHDVSNFEPSPAESPFAHSMKVSRTRAVREACSPNAHGITAAPDTA